MGSLIAKAYPTKLFLKAADHTYVECGTGAKAWSCWGGKTNGVRIASGAGSTKRADSVAEANERAQIPVYLVNGVCHQAANRILTQTKIQVSNARGYWLSQSIFGTFGKPSPYNRHLRVIGEIPACSTIKTRPTDELELSTLLTEQQVANERWLRQEHTRFIKMEGEAHTTSTIFDFMKANTQAFEASIRFRLNGLKLASSAMRGLLYAKETVEIKHFEISKLFLSKQIDSKKFIKLFNAMTKTFQDETSNALSAEAYVELFKLFPDERIVLADPAAIDLAFGDGTATAVYGDELN